MKRDVPEGFPKFRKPPKPRRKAWNSTLPAGTPREPREVPGLRSAAFAVARGSCQAHGLHHPDCPRHSSDRPGDFAAHHIHPRSLGGSDLTSNLLWVWGGPSRVGGCHGTIHQHPAVARALGLLSRGPSDMLFRFGLLAAVKDGLVTEQQVRDALRATNQT